MVFRSNCWDCYLSFCFLAVYVNQHCSERHRMIEVKVLSNFYQCSQAITLVNIEVSDNKLVANEGTN